MNAIMDAILKWWKRKGSTSYYYYRISIVLLPLMAQTIHLDSLYLNSDNMAGIILVLDSDSHQVFMENRLLIGITLGFGMILLRRLADLSSSCDSEKPVPWRYQQKLDKVYQIFNFPIASHLQLLVYLYCKCFGIPHYVHHSKQEGTNHKHLQNHYAMKTKTEGISHQIIVRDERNINKCHRREKQCSIDITQVTGLYFKNPFCLIKLSVYLPVRFPLPWNAAIGTKSRESPMLQN